MTTKFNEQRFEEIKKMVSDFVDDREIEVSELDSAEYDSNIYGVEPQYAVGGYDYDEDEYYAKQLEEAIECIKADGLFEVIDIEETEEPVYQEKVIKWLEELKEDVE